MVFFIIECISDLSHKGISNEAEWRYNSIQDILAKDL